MRLVILLIGLLVSSVASGQETSSEKMEGIDVNVFVNYGTAYRDGHWVPVDVLVRNGERDISGWVEVRLLNASGQVQSPVYRVAAESPRQSLKRFRVYCRPELSTRLEVQLYHGRQAVLDFPSWINIAPIEPSDFLCLALDNQPEQYGFLSTALYQEGQAARRFYREALNEEQLSLLAEHAACYSAFDLIVLGDIDPARISETPRRLLEEYVRGGGLLVVMLGENAARYRGSWVEGLLGATVGEEVLTDQAALLAGAFGESGGDATLQGYAAPLHPVDDTVFRLGDAGVFATLRPLGQGGVAAVAIDAGSTLLNDSEGFQALWRSLAQQSGREASLDLGGLQNTLSLVPAVAGVTLLPLWSVVMYLGLYFLIAIVANWKFWSWMQRREWAWLCLVLLSFAFTAYAVLYGTAGRAAQTELEVFEVVRLPAGARQAEHTVFTGLLSEGSSRYSGTLPGENPLVHEIAANSLSPRQQGGGLRGLGIAPQPFRLVQDMPARFEDLYVGASAIRFLATQTPRTLPGGIAGTLDLRNQVLRGELENQTGLTLRNPQVYFQGSMYTVTEQDGKYRVTQVRMGEEDPYYHHYRYFDDAEQEERLKRFKQYFLHDLFADFQGDPSTLSTTLAPHFIAEIVGGPETRISVDQESTANLHAAFLLAELPVSGASGNKIPVPVQLLPMSSSYSHEIFRFAGSNALPGNFGELSRELVLPGEHSLTGKITTPAGVSGAGAHAVELDVYSAMTEDVWEIVGPSRLGNIAGLPPPGSAEDAHLPVVRLGGEQDANLTPVDSLETDSGGLRFQLRRYRLPGEFRPGETVSFQLFLSQYNVPDRAFFLRARAIPVPGTKQAEVAWR